MLKTGSCLSIIVVLLSARGSVAQEARPDKPRLAWAQKQGDDFLAAYEAYLAAPRHRFDYQPAAKAFAMIARTGKGDRKELSARCLLTLCRLFSRQFSAAHTEALRLRDLAGKLYPNDAKVRVMAGLVARERDLDSYSTVRDMIIAASRIRPVFPGKEEVADLGIAQAAELLDFVDLTRSLQSSVDQKAQDKVAELERGVAQAKGQDQEEMKLCLDLLKQNLAGAEQGTAAPMLVAAATVGAFAPGVLPDAAGLQEDVAAITCANHLRQLGLAALMYAADHNGCLPPLWVATGTPTQEELTWCGLLMPYLGLKRETAATGGWSGKPDLLEVVPRDSAFLCPGREHHWTTSRTRGAEYGYLDCLGSGKVRLSHIAPSRQVLLTESLYGCRVYHETQVVLAHRGLANFLYADGHVEAHDREWISAHPFQTPPGENNPWNTIR